MIRVVSEIPSPRANKGEPSLNMPYFELADKTPNEYLMIPCGSKEKAYNLSRSLRYLNKYKFNTQYEVFKREEVVYLKKRKVDA